MFEIEKDIRIIETLTQEMTEIRISGGATRSTVFNQIQADVYGKTVMRGISEQSSALGAIIIASVGIGLYPDVATAVEATIAFDTHEKKFPDERAHQVYETMSTLHNEIYLALSSHNIYAKAGELRELLQSY